MKKLWIICIAVMVIACKKEERNTNTNKTSIISKKSENFDWLLGQWKRLDEEKGKETFENWEKHSDTEYWGIGFTLQNNDTIKQERIKLKKENKSWNLMVKTPDEAEATVFKMTTFDANKFICENTAIDFPNRIKYWKTDNYLNATVSNTEIIISFKFKKISQ